MSVMLDLETLSTRSNAYILSIGAIEFDPKTGSLGKAFYETVDAETWAEGFHIDPATVKWWMIQTPEARALVSKKGTSFPHALVLFENYLRTCGGHECEVWGNGSDFDNVILGNAYKYFKKDTPWSFWNNRCYRTFKNLYHIQLPAQAPVEALVARGAVMPDNLPEGIFTAHSALGDAVGQARALMTAYGHGA